MNHHLEQIQQDLMMQFQASDAGFQRSDLLKVSLSSRSVRSALAFLKQVAGFKHFVMMSCVDRIEDNLFELVWIVWHPTHHTHVMLKTTIDRAHAEFETLTDLWRQIETYEREIWEMYGINFVGHPRLESFVLEDWDGQPPMRRDFDTLHFVNNTFIWREGREENHAPREFIAEQFDEWRNK